MVFPGNFVLQLKRLVLSMGSILDFSPRWRIIMGIYGTSSGNSVYGDIWDKRVDSIWILVPSAALVYGDNRTSSQMVFPFWFHVPLVDFALDFSSGFSVYGDK